MDSIGSGLFPASPRFHKILTGGGGGHITEILSHIKMSQTLLKIVMAMTSVKRM